MTTPTFYTPQRRGKEYGRHQGPNGGAIYLKRYSLSPRKKVAWYCEDGRTLFSWEVVYWELGAPRPDGTASQWVGRDQHDGTVTIRGIKYRFIRPALIKQLIAAGLADKGEDDARDTIVVDTGFRPLSGERGFVRLHGFLEQRKKRRFPFPTISPTYDLELSNPEPDDLPTWRPPPTYDPPKVRSLRRDGVKYDWLTLSKHQGRPEVEVAYLGQHPRPQIVPAVLGQRGGPEGHSKSPHSGDTIQDMPEPAAA